MLLVGEEHGSDSYFVKISPNDSCANCIPNSNLKQYLKAEKFWAKEKYDLIEEHNFLKNCKLVVIDLMRLGCGWGMELVLQLGRVLHRTKIQFPKKLFSLVFCSC
jgi:hypothetical protein